MAEGYEDDLTPEEEKQLILRIIKYVKKHHRVTLTQITGELQLDDTDRRYLEVTLVKKRDVPGNNPNHILAAANRPETNKAGGFREDEYQLLPTAVFSYIDYLEIKEARKAASEAKRLSTRAIQIAVWSLIVGAVLGLVQIIVDVACRP